MPGARDPSEWLDRAACDYPERLFLRAPARDITYAELQELTGRIAGVLRLRGVAPGDRVAVQVEKSVEAVLLYVACLRCGAVFVPMNTACAPNEFEYFVRDCDPRLVIVDPRRQAQLEPLARSCGIEQVETLAADGKGTVTSLAVAQKPIAMSRADLGFNALAAIVYTSGTTGRPKGAMLTRGNLSSNATVLADFWRFTPQDALLHVLPLFHVHGLFVAINTVLAAGSSLWLMDKFDPRATVRLLSQVSVFMGVPTHYTRLLQEGELSPASTAGMRLFVSGSAPLLAQTHHDFFERTGHRILERYGMTETLMNASNPYDGERVPGSVGPPLPGVSIQVVNERGEPLREPDAIGALEIKGPNVFAGYWRAAEKTRAEFTSDGWFKTGDLGKFDANGYVYIVGRAKDLVISGGYNVYPKEVETELDAVGGVVESAVFGVAHPDFGEGVTAAVVIDQGVALTESQILAALHLRLSRYKIPKRVLIIDELPRNAMGKVQKSVLRQRYASLYT